jgi:actin, other eukaryote
MVTDQVINNFVDFENYLNYFYTLELKKNSQDYPAFITTDSSETNISETIQIFFEKFQVPSFCSFPSIILSMYSSGSETGLSVDSGYASTRICSIYDGLIVSGSEIKIPIGGEHLTDYAIKLTKKQKKHSFSHSYFDLEILDTGFKHKFLRASMNYSEDFRCSSDVTCNDNGNYSPLVWDIENIMIPELFFNPSMDSIESFTLPDGVKMSLKQVDADVRSKMCENIVLSGGNSFIVGIAERLAQELKYNLIYEISVKDNLSERFYGNGHSAWLGGSIVSSMSSFRKNFLSKELYDEVGRNNIHHKIQNSSDEMKVFHLRKISKKNLIEKFRNISFYFE